MLFGLFVLLGRLFGSRIAETHVAQDYSSYSCEFTADDRTLQIRSLATSVSINLQYAHEKSMAMLDAAEKRRLQLEMNEIRPY